MLKAASLFAGIGGFDLALADLNIEVVLQAEIDSNAQKVLRANFPDAALEADATQVDLRGIDLVTAGFPCQGLSIAAHTRKYGGLFDPNSMSYVVWDVLDRVFTARPAYLLLENADSLSTARYRQDLLALLESLANNGYETKIVHLNSGCYGSNMRRTRTFILARLHAWTVQDVDDEVVWENFTRAAGVSGQQGGSVFEAQPSITKKAGSYTLMVTQDEVRSVTPEGVEYLFGFPAGWTCAAGADFNRYARLGNAVSVDCARAAVRLLLGHSVKAYLPDQAYYALYDLTRPAVGGTAASCIRRIISSIKLKRGTTNKHELVYLLPVYRRWARDQGGLSRDMEKYLTEIDQLVPDTEPVPWPDTSTVRMTQRGVITF